MFKVVGNLRPGQKFEPNELFGWNNLQYEWSKDYNIKDKKGQDLFTLIDWIIYFEQSSFNFL